jgi:hypothetical protein
MVMKLEKINALVNRIDAIEFTTSTLHGIETKAVAEQLKHLLMCQCLNSYGIKTANRMIEIWEKYNNRK